MAAVTLSGHLSSSVAPSAATVLFVLGALAGFVHGGIFGYLGRDLDRPRHTALRGLAVGTALLLPTLPLAWLAAVLVAMTSASLASGQISFVLGSALGWVASATICTFGAVEGWRALQAAFERWPERRAGTLIISGVLAVLSLSFFMARPAIWFTEVRVTGVGAL
ncbi:MAG TPA: hypothetical protein VLA43_18950, partial [Longimicrobiales bacterium]|nr:hypothetical protein [Longimicrobiales bacterium]